MAFHVPLAYWNGTEASGGSLDSAIQMNFEGLCPNMRGVHFEPYWLSFLFGVAKALIAFLWNIMARRYCPRDPRSPSRQCCSCFPRGDMDAGVDASSSSGSASASSPGEGRAPKRDGYSESDDLLENGISPYHALGSEEAPDASGGLAPTLPPSQSALPSSGPTVREEAWRDDSRAGAARLSDAVAPEDAGLVSSSPGTSSGSANSSLGGNLQREQGGTEGRGASAGPRSLSSLSSLSTLSSSPSRSSSSSKTPAVKPGEGEGDVDDPVRVTCMRRALHVVDEEHSDEYVRLLVPAPWLICISFAVQLVRLILILVDVDWAFAAPRPAIADAAHYASHGYDITWTYPTLDPVYFDPAGARGLSHWAAYEQVYARLLTSGFTALMVNLYVYRTHLNWKHEMPYMMEVMHEFDALFSGVGSLRAVFSTFVRFWRHSTTLPFVYPALFLCLPIVPVYFTHVLPAMALYVWTIPCLLTILVVLGLAVRYGLRAICPSDSHAYRFLRAFFMRTLLFWSWEVYPQSLFLYIVLPYSLAGGPLTPAAYRGVFSAEYMLRDGACYSDSLTRAFRNAAGVVGNII